MMNQVFGIKCRTYDQAEAKTQALLNMMGGIGAFVAEGEKIVLKANLLLPAAPEKAITTHPHIVTAVGRMVNQHGASALVTDSPGAGYQYNERMMRRIYRVCGLEKACGEAGIALNFDTSAAPVSYPNGKLIKRFEVITPVLNADGVINLCKLKTHLFMHMTGAVKNSFGVIPGLAKPGYHAKLHDTSRFADMLVDLSTFASPRLSVMDAVVGMEGEGPNNGDPRPIGLILASVNPLALDVVAGEIMGIDPMQNPVLQAAARRGLSPARLDEVELIGVEASELRIPDFRLPSTIYGEKGLGPLPLVQKLMTPLFKNGLTVKPRINKDKCTACGACHDSCPVGAITLYAHLYAEIDEDTCIRCYCCHEMCPFDAVYLHKSLLYKVVNRLERV